MQKALTYILVGLALCSLAVASSRAQGADASLMQGKYAELVRSSPEVTTLRCELSNIDAKMAFVNGQAFSSVALPGEPTTFIPGQPVLPSVARFVVVHPTSNLALYTTHSEPRRVRAEAPPLLLEAETGVTVDFVPPEDGLFPAAVAELSTPFIIHGVRMVKVTIHPIRYDAKSNEYLHYENIETEVRAVEGEPVNPIVGTAVRGFSPDFLNMIENLAVNGDIVRRDDPDRDKEPPYVGKYLVAINSECIRWTIPYIEFRRKTGYKMDILSLATGGVANDPNGIKQAIQQRYDAQRQAGELFDYLLLVGDRSAYQYEPGPGAILQAPTGVSSWPNAPHADYEYACLQGQDQIMDVGWARFAGGNEATLGLIVGRQLAVSATPDLRNPAVYLRAGVYSQHWGNGANQAWHIGQPMNVRWAEEVLQAQGFTDVRWHENFNWDQHGHSVGPFIRDLLNLPVNILTGRAENYYYTNRDNGNRNFEADIRNNTHFPINLNTCGHGEWAGEIMFRRGNANNLKGYLTSTFGWGTTMTGAQNVIWMELTNGVVQKDMPQGWAWTYAHTQILRYFPNDLSWNGRNVFLQHQTDNNIFGDPGFKPWMGMPRVVAIQHTDSIAPDTKLIEVFVHQPGSQEPVAGATVTLYAPGNLPQDPAQYAQYNAMLQKVTTTGPDGRVRFVLSQNERFVANTLVYITASGRDIAPRYAQVRISTPRALLDIAEWSLIEISGNGDDAVNPTEMFGLRLRARNLGNGNPVESVMATVRSLSPYVIVEDNAEVWFGDIPAGQTVNAERDAELFFSPLIPDGPARPALKPTLEVEFVSGELSWKSALRIDPRASHLECRRVFIGNSPTFIIPDSVCQIDIEVANVGSIASPVFAAELRSLGMGATVIEGFANYEAIARNGVGRTVGGRFTISGNKVVVPGSKTKMMLIMSSNEGILDTSYFDLQVMRPRDRAPFGPDKFGYICFDDTDTSWDIAPEYDWVEICPDVQDRDFTGTRLNFTGQSPNDIGECRVIALGCTTQFYGRLYDTITVATNGFIGMGVQPRMVNYQRWPLDQSIGCAAGMIAPFWNDLRLGQGAGVFYYHDTLDNRIIIQWYRMRFASGEGEATFQVILYDHAWWITDESGNQNILFQYRTISNPTNTRDGDQLWITGVQYASVGISDPAGKSGLNYTWNNEYTPGAATLANRRAILWTTSPRFRAGTLYGWVVDFWTFEPIEGAIIFTKHGFVGYTDETGYWRIAESLAEVPFDITVRKQGYNDSTLTGLFLPEGDSLELNFEILHPEFTPSTFRIDAMLDPDLEIRIPFTLWNGGNGPLYWSAEKRLLGDANAAPWELRRSYWVGDTLDDDRIEGVAFDGDNFYLSGAAGNNPNLIYVVDRDGNRVRDFVQPGESVYGMKDLEWDGELLWGSGEQRVFGFDRDGNVAAEFNGPFNPNQAIAYDPEDGILWVCALTNNISAYDRQGNGLNRTLNRRGLRIYGLAYWADDPDGYPLYILNSPAQNILCVHKMNVVNGDTLLVQQLPTRGSPGGAYITNTFDVYSWVLISTTNVPPNEGGDRIDIFQIEARRDWLDLDVWSGTLNPQEVQDFVLTLNSTGLPDTLFQGELRFYHNADSSVGHIYVNLDVIGVMDPFPFDLAYPANGDSITAAPLYNDSLKVPDIRFAWHPARDPNIADSLMTYTFTAVCLERVWTHIISRDTFLIVNLDSLRMPLGFDRPVTWSVSAVSGENGAGGSTNCVTPFSFWIKPNALDEDKLQPPLEFALKSVYPNPFNMKSAVRFSLDRAGPARLAVFDIHGRQAARLFDGETEAGLHTLTWNAEGLPSGVYLLRLESADRTKLAKVTLIR